MNELPLRLTVVCGDRSGPFFQDYGIPFVFFQKYNLIQPTAVDAISIDAVKSAEVVQFQRQYAPESLLTLRHLKADGVPTISHVDDNVWEIPDGNPAKTTYTGPILERFHYIMHEAHAVTTNNPYLVKLCRKYNEHVYMFRNLMNPEVTDFLSPGRDNPNEIRIGWTTTPHHHDDFPVAKDALRVILGKYQNTKLIFIGWLPEFINEVPFNRFEFYGFVPVDAFYSCFANLDFDIGIAPLIENGFNHGKTARKAQEYAMLKIPMVLSNVSTYREWVHGETCIKTGNNDTEGWIKALSWMIEHPVEKVKLVDKAYEQCMRNHDINKYIWERAATYYQVYKQVVGQSHPYAPIIQEGLRERNISVEEEL